VQRESTTKPGRWPIRTLLLLTVLAVPLHVLTAQFFARHSITRDALGITQADLDRQSDCAKWQVPIFKAKAFNREEGAYAYLQYAVAAAAVYRSEPDDTSDAHFAERASGDQPIPVTLNETYRDRWATAARKHVERSDSPTRLTYDVYFRDEPDHLSVLIAFRGTTLPWDWWSNASWLTRPLHVADHYGDARKAFADVRSEALSRAGGKPVHYVATGHSLGGGLAMHVAFGFPCVSAVVFNASPVINRHLYSDPFELPHVVLLYQHCEILGAARSLVGGQEVKRNSLGGRVLATIQDLFGGEALGANFHDYDYDLYNVGRREAQQGCWERWRGDDRHFHNMDNYVQALARFAADCEFQVTNKGRTAPCTFAEFLPARRVYCPSFGRAIPSRRADDPICKCANWPAASRARLKDEGACF
jgi:dienelactone hydrolase